MVVLKLELFTILQASSRKLKQKHNLPTNQPRTEKQTMCVSVCASLCVYVFQASQQSYEKIYYYHYFTRTWGLKVNCPWSQADDRDLLLVQCYSKAYALSTVTQWTFTPGTISSGIFPGLLFTHSWGHTILAYSF